MLKPDQKDDLVRMMNDYMISAADMLTETMNQKVELSTSSVFLANDTNLDTAMGELISGFPYGDIVSCSISFTQNIPGRSFILLSIEQARYLAEKCFQETRNTELKVSIISFDLVLDVIKEIGNVVLNVIMARFAEFMQLKTNYSLPQVGHIFMTEDDLGMIRQEQLYILVFPIYIHLEGSGIKGALALAFGLDAMAMLLGKIDQHPKEEKNGYIISKND